MSSQTCDVRYGPHSVVGDLQNYDVEVAPVNGIGVSLHYEALVDPYRPGGTAYVALGADNEYYSLHGHVDPEEPRHGHGRGRRQDVGCERDRIPRPPVDEHPSLPGVAPLAVGQVLG